MYFSDQKTKRPVTPAMRQLLRETTITEGGPGTILRDFQALLDFVPAEGLEAAGKHHMLPMKSLPALNARMARPVELGLQRPQLRSYPNLQGLHLLARATGLFAVRGAGDKARLVLRPEAMEAWHGLNPTERYMTLLEAFVLRATPDLLGDTHGGWLRQDCLLLYALEVWGRMPSRRKTWPAPTNPYDGGWGMDHDHYTTALLDLFGLVRIEYGRPIQGKGPWLAATGRTDFGDALLTRLLNSPLVALAERMSGGFGIPGLGGPLDDDEVTGKGKGGKGHAPALPSPAAEAAGPMRFDLLRPLLGEFFPEWENTYVLPPFGFRDGTFVLKVSLYKAAWWRLAVPASLTLDDLSDSILDCARFERDHLYSFTLTDRLGRRRRAMCPYCDETNWAFTDEVRVGDLPLEAGESITYLFDFGDSWTFDVKLERIDPPVARRKSVKVLERHGKPPKQYPGEDEDEDEDEEEDE